jgi:hypothetical protein
MTLYQVELNEQEAQALQAAQAMHPFPLSITIRRDMKDHAFRGDFLYRLEPMTPDATTPPGADTTQPQLPLESAEDDLPQSVA